MVAYCTYMNLRRTQVDNKKHLVFQLHKHCKYSEIVPSFTMSYQQYIPGTKFLVKESYNYLEGFGNYHK